jgi:hypothetical protein
MELSRSTYTIVKYKRIVFAVVLSLLVLLASVTLYFSYTERQEAHFKTYQELRDSELMAKGWVPSFIPSSAYDIYEKHRVDEGRVDVKFRFARGDIAKIETSCTRQIGKDSSVTLYKCGHRNDMVSVRLSEDGKGEIFSE